MAEACNVFRCLRCQKFQAVSLRLLLRHYRLVHANDLSFNVKCNVSGCPSIFKRFNSYYKHVTRKHKQIYDQRHVSYEEQETQDLENDEDDNDEIIEDVINENHFPTDDDHDDDNVYEDDDDVDDCDEFDSNDDDDAADGDDDDSMFNAETIEHATNPDLCMRKNSARFILKTKERNMLTQVTMDRIVDNVSCLVDQYSDILRKEIIDRMELNQESDQDTLSDIFGKMSNIFEGISTEAQQKTFIKENFPHFAAEKVHLGSILARKKGNNGKVISEKVENFMYIPLLKSLELMLGNSTLAKLLLRKPTLNDGCFYDFFDGSLYGNDSYFSEHPNALPLILYHDELEVCNPLGSSAGSHKIDMYYYSLANIPPKFRSRHCAVKLLAIVKASFVKKYGVEKVLSPIIDDLLILHDGHEIQLANGETITLHGKVLVCLGETLGQHLWGGFKEGVGFAYQKCRQCYCDFDVLQTTFRLQSLTLRTKELYDQHCSEIENAVTEAMRSDLKMTYGINKRSALCNLPSFDIITQLPQDIMHIAFEGFVQYELRLVLEKMLNEKLTSLKDINSSILSHNFGYSEIASKPNKLRDTVFNGDERYKLKLNASQARLFLRIFPFLMEPLIDTDNEYFLFVLNLIDIIQTLCSPVIQEQTIFELNDKISQHFTDFRALFPDKNLLPKHHYLLHLTNSIHTLGPPIRYSCFSFEAAHSYFKSLARSQNFKNLPYSLAKRYQYLETCNYGDQNEDSLSHPLFEKERMYGVVKELSNSEKIILRKKFDESGLLPGINFTNAVKVSWVIRYGTKYSRNGILAVDVDSTTQLPLFGKIISIFIIYDFVYFEIAMYSSIHYSQLFHAYHVELRDIISYYSYTSLLDYNVLHIKSDSDNNIYIQPKYSLRDIVAQHIKGSLPVFRLYFIICYFIETNFYCE